MFLMHKFGQNAETTYLCAVLQRGQWEIPKTQKRVGKVKCDKKTQKIMKKILLMAAFAVASLTANAQVWVGGALGFDYEKYENMDGKTQFTLAPVVGYNLSEDWALGLELSFSFGNTGASYLYANQKTQDILVAPFARYTFARAGVASFFVDGGFGLGSHKVGNADADTQWHIGFRPGVAFNINEHVSFVGTTGYLGFRHMDHYNHFGLNANNQLVTVGFYYTF
jgi:hypothetical protein